MSNFVSTNIDRVLRFKRVVPAYDVRVVVGDEQVELGRGGFGRGEVR